MRDLWLLLGGSPWRAHVASPRLRAQKAHFCSRWLAATKGHSKGFRDLSCLLVVGSPPAFCSSMVMVVSRSLPRSHYTSLDFSPLLSASLPRCPFLCIGLFLGLGKTGFASLHFRD
ncbi:uncharacterized protein G2W53_032844 [Senna tora]|uniref:Uncharacterized protein n=1 Tax=Senna tora TaxID=362788 RepID=A0A834SWL9_9FABA|nr:uncharacterized protein G2W53_032844 [Senna tora]